MNQLTPFDVYFDLSNDVIKVSFRDFFFDARTNYKIHKGIIKTEGSLSAKIHIKDIAASISPDWSPDLQKPFIKIDSLKLEAYSFDFDIQDKKIPHFMIRAFLYLFQNFIGRQVFKYLPAKVLPQLNQALHTLIQEKYPNQVDLGFQSLGLDISVPEQPKI